MSWLCPKGSARRPGRTCPVCSTTPACEPADQALDDRSTPPDASRFVRYEWLLLALFTLLALALRLAATYARDSLNADEAVFGLMARHIAAGQDTPVFYYGQAYFGALEAYLDAALFRLLGFNPWLVLFPPAVFAALLVPLTWLIARQIAPWPAGLVAALPLAVPPPVLAGLLGNAGGGFALAFALHQAVLLLLLRALAAHTRVVAWAASFSLMAGVLCWIWQPALALYPVLLAFLVWRQRELHRPLPLIMAVAPVIVGLAPMLIYNLANDWASVQEIQAKVTAHVEESSFFFGSPARTFLAFLLLALGGGDEHVGWPNPLQAILVAAAFPGLLVLVIRWRHRPRLDQRALAVVALMLAAAVDAAAAHQTVRHLTPAALVGLTLLGPFLTLVLQTAGPTVAVVVAALTLVVPNVWLARTASFTFDVARDSDVQAAIQALDMRGLRTGYTDYWAAYPVEYFSQERLVLAPSLPSPLGGFDRYAPYSYEVGLVENPRELFLLVDNRCTAAPYEQALTEVGATFQAERVARWTLLWDFQSAPGRETETLDALHAAIGAANTC